MSPWRLLRRLLFDGLLAVTGRRLLFDGLLAVTGRRLFFDGLLAVTGKRLLFDGLLSDGKAAAFRRLAMTDGTLAPSPGFSV